MNTYTTAAPPSAAPAETAGPAPDWTERSLLRYMRLIDPPAMVLWVMATTLTIFPVFGPLRYLLTAYFALGMVLHFRQVLPNFLRGWPILILPALFAISALWAPSANEAVRKGLLMFLTGAVACYAASRLSIRQIIAIYFLGETLGAILSFMNPTVVGGNWTGIFGQKNHLAVHMFILYTTGFAIMLDKGSNKFLRLSTLGFIPLAALMIVMSKSATTTVMMGLAAMAFLGHQFLWEPAARIKHARAFLVALIALFGTLGALMLFGLFHFDAMDTLLKAFGKDSTLTGRTFLWQIAERTMDQHPFTGLGANGFWRQELGAANEITTFFFYESYVKFSFHNSYLENGVQLGYPGMYATIFVVSWGMFNIAVTWMRNQTLLNAAMLILAITVVMRSNAEIDFAMEFAGTAVMFYIGAMRIERPRKKAGPSRPLRPELAPMPVYGPVYGRYGHGRYGE